MFSLGPQCTRRLGLLPQRCISSSAPAFAGPPRRKRDDADEDDEEPKEPKAPKEEDDSDAKTFGAFLAKHQRFKTAKPRHWLAATSENPDPGFPFPLNPSFKPPAPISDGIRSRMYQSYMMDPEKNSIRELSQRYHVSLKRVEAILRLKGLEAAYVKDNKPLQTGFQWGMEMLLGVKHNTAEQLSPLRNVHMADMLEQEENRDADRQRFQRQYWESIADDGKEPLLPASLEHARNAAERSAQAAHDNKSNTTLMPRFKDTTTIKSPRAKVQKIEREGRLPIHFVDVGGKFLQVDERLRRMASAGRRHSIHAKRSEVKVLSGFLKGRTSVERARRASAKRPTLLSTS
ncbi:eukaryotic mitochondrial regulator protein-domain-containing protein [Mycena capillaripes]|nr:eukaryotic mitochondrial regulator protein-domain-containing protein [Mycena capillaripes]